MPSCPASYAHFVNAQRLRARLLPRVRPPVFAIAGFRPEGGLPLGWEPVKTSDGSAALCGHTAAHGVFVPSYRRIFHGIRC